MIYSSYSNTSPKQILNFKDKGVYLLPDGFILGALPHS